MANNISHEQYKIRYIWKRIDIDWFPPKAPYQCVDVAKHYTKYVWWYSCWSFWWSAYQWWINRATTFRWCDTVSGRATVPVGSLVIFKPYATIKTKKPWAIFWKNITFTKYGHIGIIDYIDNTGVIRIIEQNGWNGNGDGLWSNAIRLRWYCSKDAVAWFVLQND